MQISFTLIIAILSISFGVNAASIISSKCMNKMNIDIYVLRNY